MSLVPPLKWHGGKSYLAKKIIGLMPFRCRNPNAPSADDQGYLHYVEPFFGGGAVMLANDPEGISEVANDLNGRLAEFWGTIQCETSFNQFLRVVQAVPFSKREFDAASEISPHCSSMNGAVAFFIACRQSLSGRMDSFAGISRTRTRQGMNEQVAAWLSCIEGLPEVHARLKRVLILNKPALEVIRSEDGPRTLFYLDPPYLHETRATTGEYEHEMSNEQHKELLITINSIEGRFLLSGYRSEMYDEWAFQSNFARHDFAIDNKSAGGKTKRKMIECVWTNF